MLQRVVVFLVFFFSVLVTGYANGESEVTAKLDISAFKKRQAQNQGEYVAPNGNQVQEIEFAGGFVQKETKKDSPYVWYREYYKNGALKREGRLVSHGGVDTHLGKWRGFSYKGKITKTEDFEKGFTVSYEQVLEICKTRGIDLTHRLSSLSRSKPGPQTEWIVSWDSGEIVEGNDSSLSEDLSGHDVNVIKNISIDGQTGAIRELPDGHHIDN